MSSFNELMRRADKTLVETFNVDNGVTLFPDTPQEITVQGVYDAPFLGLILLVGVYPVAIRALPCMITIALI